MLEQRRLRRAARAAATDAVRARCWLDYYATNILVLRRQSRDRIAAAELPSVSGELANSPGSS